MRLHSPTRESGILLWLAILFFHQFGLAQNTPTDSLERVLKTNQPDSSRIKVLHKLATGWLGKNPQKSLQFSVEAKNLGIKTGNHKWTSASLQLMAKACKANHSDSLALAYAEKSLALARELGDLMEISGSLGVINRIYDQTNVLKCIPVLEEKIAIDKQLNDPVKLSQDYLVLGDKLRAMAKNDRALESFTTAYEILLKAGLKEKTGRCLQGMAGQNYILGYYPMAVSMLNEAIRLNLAQKDWIAVGDNYNLMGVVYRKKGPVDSAIFWYTQCINHFTSLNERARTQFPLNNLGNIYQDLKQFDKAIVYRQKSLAVYKETDQKNQMGLTLTSLALTYLEMNLWDKALQTMDSAYNLNKKYGIEWDARRHWFQTKAKVYEAKGILDSALLYHKLYISIRDSIYGKESTDKMEKLRLEFETRRKEDEIDLLKKDNLLKGQQADQQRLLLQNAALQQDKSRSEVALLSQTLSIEKSKALHSQWELQLQKLWGEVSENKLASLNQQHQLLEKEKLLNQAESKERLLERNLLIIGSILFVSFAILIFYRIRISNQKTRIQTLTRISRDLHDNLGSTLGSITVYSEMAKTMKEGKLQEVLGKIEENSRESVDMMGDLVWSLNPANESLEKLMLRLKNYATDVLQPNGYTLNFEMDEKLGSQKTTLEQRTNLFLIAKEALYNTSKYSRGSLVSVRFLKIQGGLRLHIEDNGIGFSDVDLALARNGNGIRNMKIRAKEIKANFSLESAPGQGTRVQLDLV